MTNTTRTFEEIRQELNTGNYGDRIADYDSGYISDVLTEIADNCTSIYYNDIMHFITNNVQSLQEVIEEGLYDPTHGYNLYEHGQAAEFMTIERELWNSIDDILMCYCINYIRVNYHTEIFNAELIEELEIEIDGNPDTLDTLNDIINCWFIDNESEEG